MSRTFAAGAITMKYTLGIGTYFSIPVKVHITFPLILIAFGVEAWFDGGWLAALSSMLLVLLVFVCVVLHEFGHSLQIRRYGIKVRDIVLLPIGGMARAERIPEKPRQEIIVAISGPLVNFVLAGIFFGILSLQGDSTGLAGDLMVHLFWINMVLGTFNLIPAFPMDGGRILRGALATRVSYVTATRYAKNVGQIIAILFVILGFSFQKLIMLPLIAVFVFFGAISEERLVRLKAALENKSAQDYLRTDSVMLLAEGSIEDAAAATANDRRFAYPVTDATGKMAGAVEKVDLVDAIEAGRGAAPLRQLVRTGFPLVNVDTSAFDVYHILRSQKAPVVGVLDNDLFRGLVFFDDLSSLPAR